MGLLNKLSTKARGIKEIGLAGLVSAGIGLGMTAPENAYSQEQNRPGVSSEGSESIIKRDYRDREHDWKLYKEEAKKPVAPGAIGDRISNTNQGDRVSHIGEQPKSDSYIESQSKLSENYNAEDFAKAYGIAKWNFCLSEQDKQKIKELFGKLDIEKRKTLCNIYDKTGISHDVYLTKEGKERFAKFNQAYKYLAETKPEKTSESFLGLKNTEMFLRKSTDPASEILVSRDELARELKESYPWINLNSGKPLNVADRVLVLWHIDHLERNLGKKVVNWNSVEKYAKMPFEEEF